MIVSIGTDIVCIERMRKSLSSEGDGRFERRFLTEAELAYCQSKHDPAESISARFAAKEAVMKCLGTGWDEGVSWQDIEVTKDERGAPGVKISGRALEIAQARGIAKFHLSLSHTKDHAVAMAVAESGSADS